MATTPVQPVMLAPKSQEGLLQYLRSCISQHDTQWNLREQMQRIDQAYAREAEFSVENERAKGANRNGDKDRYQNITLPVVMPQVESAVTYQASVFLTGIPLFGVSSSPQYMNEALQLETVIDDQAIRGGWSREFTLFFRDGFKYNLSAIECAWEREVTWAPETDIGFQGGKVGKPVEVIWEGNKLHRWDMYNSFWDTRVHPAEMHTHGDFAGTTRMMSRIRLKQLIKSLPEARIDNIKAAFESGTGAINVGTSSGQGSYFIPQINPKALLDPQFSGNFNWAAWAGIAGADLNKIAYKDMYEVTTVYCRILPSDFSIRTPESNTPQIWKLIFVNRQVLIYAERQTNAHNMLPVLFGQPLEDGLGYQTKSLAENVSPIQDITSALSNSNIANRRRALSDRALYDPSRIDVNHINNPNPSAKIPVRPAAYGKPVGEAVYAFPFRDDQAQFVGQQIQMYGSMANMISGQNPVRQGQFVKGNKTQSEFQDVMAHANGRDQLTAMGYESQIFTPLKEMMKINILQYQGGTSLYNREKKADVKIDPVELRRAVMQFKVSDGLVPTDKLMNSDSWAIALQQLGSSAQLGAAYNLGPMFSYLMKIKGADLSAFEKSPQQQQYEQATQQWQQTVIQLFKQNPQLTQQQLPPQPKPQDFGYDPAQQAGADKSAAPTQVTAQPAA